MNSLLRRGGVALIAIAALGLASCGSAAAYAAQVNGVRLSRADLDRELNAIAGNESYMKALQGAQVRVQGSGGGTFDTAFVAKVLTRRIYLELIHEEVVRRKLRVGPSDIASARQELISNLGDAKTVEAFPKAYAAEITRTTAEVHVLQSGMAKVDDSPAGLARFYAAHQDQFEKECAAHILVETRKEADAIEKQLKVADDPKATFADIAMKQSKDPGSGAKGGDLGCAAPGGYVPAFRDAVRTQAIGVIGPPVQTQFGFHIIRVDDRTPPPPLADVEVDVRQALVGSSQSAFNDFLSKASTTARITVNPRYGKFDRTGQSPQVVPPTSPGSPPAPAPAPAPGG